MPGGSTISLTPGAGQNATLNFGTLTRSSGGTLTFSGSNLGSAAQQIKFSGIADNTLLPYATVNGTALANYTTANGIAPAATITSLTAGADVKLSANTTLSSSMAVNS